MKVHYRAKGAIHAPCGYVYDKRAKGLDHTDTWDMHAPYPVSCVDCLLRRPPKRRRQPFNPNERFRG